MVPDLHPRRIEQIDAHRAAGVREVARLDALLASRRTDQQLYCTAVPRLSGATIAAYARHRPAGFARVLLDLGEHARPPLPFELCEELARFYAVVFRHAAPDSLRRLALSQLLSLGPVHRRYAVADVVRELLWSLRRRRDVELAADVLARSSWTGWYAHHTMFRGALDERLAAALNAAGRGAGVHGALADTRAGGRRSSTARLTSTRGPHI